ncbi:MAG: BlaI/MecI/CopY family transcriptional regulator [Armatimonadetes bacterium]|nr:BlaI/MecI/CopY family transcriptional regulator [Armatimonadota bacterium]
MSKNRRKYVGIGGDDVPSLGVLEGEIMRYIWEAGDAQSSVQVYSAMYQERYLTGQEMQAPSTIAVTLSRMVDKGLLSIEKRPGSTKGYYQPLKNRPDVVLAVLDDVTIRLAGCTLRELLQSLPEGASPASEKVAQLQDVMDALRQLTK